MPLDTASILIAEDEEPIRRLLTRILTDAGYTTLEADTGDHALTMLDLHMPGQVDGEELLFQLRDHGDEIPKQPDQRTALRMRAWKLKQLGWKQKDIANSLGVSQTAVSDWVRR